ncbi:hypothetical protein [Sphingomonas suaedae]|uniref:hypothetical protein n=1 Tax=Sphingomonas suaedae TaxID=2599297 RepID=UPI001644D3FE|nr:hypothetical protein [Sphingomonas suaedae]
MQKLLNPDEAMVVILASDDASYTWAVTREKATWSRSEAMKDSALAEKVSQLRASMEVDGCARLGPSAARTGRGAPGGCGQGVRSQAGA